MLTSPRLYQALLQEIFRINSPKRILVVGSQIPELILKLIKSLSDEDQIVISESTKTHLVSLESLLEREPSYQRRVGQITMVNKLPWDIDEPHAFNGIVLTYPIDLMSDDQLDKMMEACRNLMAQGGTLSCMELAWLRKVREFCTMVWRKNSCQPVRSTKLEQYIDAFRVYKETIATNLPPVWINHMRFTPNTVEELDRIHAIEGRASLSLGPIKIAKDFLKFLLPLGGASWALRKWGCSLWYLPAALLGVIAAFLRDPRRKINANPDIVLSACDGKVLEVSEVTDPKLGEGKWLRIVTFLSLMNVHVNRAPVAGKVIDQFEVKGSFAKADTPSAEHNFACYTILQTKDSTVAVAQRTGMLARRIVNWVKPGELLAQGERYGLIRMGSRTDIYLPCDKYVATVAPGSHVKAGLTMVAERKKA